MARVEAELRRRDFVEATVRVIAAHGAAGATTRRIAAEVGCPLATLHYVFRTKEELFYAVYETLLDEAQILNDDALGALPLRDAAPAHYRRAIRWLAENPAYARAQAELFNWALRFNPEIATRTYDLTLDQVRAALHHSADGPHDERLIDALSRLSLALVDGFLASWFSHNDLDRLAADTETAGLALTGFLDGWVAPAPKRARKVRATARSSPERA